MLALPWRSKDFVHSFVTFFTNGMGNSIVNIFCHCTWLLSAEVWVCSHAKHQCAGRVVRAWFILYSHWLPHVHFPQKCDVCKHVAIVPRKDKNQLMEGGKPNNLGNVCTFNNMNGLTWGKGLNEEKWWKKNAVSNFGIFDLRRSKRCLLCAKYGGQGRRNSTPNLSTNHTLVTFLPERTPETACSLTRQWKLKIITRTKSLWAWALFVQSWVCSFHASFGVCWFW